MNYNSVPTVCPYCGCGCGILLQVLDGELVGTIPQKDHPISRGKLCIKGWNSHVFVTSESRLKKPLIRENGKLVETSWERALEKVAGEFKRIKESYGSDSIAVLSSAKCTNEENYLVQKFARAVLGTNNVDHCARLCHASTVAGLVRSFGSGAMTNSVPEIDETDCILVTGSNTLEQHPLIGARILEAKERGAKLIVIDPRRVPLAEFADLYLQPVPGTDVAWINAMMNVIISEGLEDKEFIEERTEGYEKLKELVEKFTPESVEKLTGVPADLLREASRMYAEAERGSIFYSMGITQHTTGTDNVRAIANLAMLTGNVGRRGTGVNPLRGQNNVQGACDLGALPNVFPGYQSVSDESIAEKFEKAWGTSLPRKPGLTVVEMIDAAFDGDLKAMFIVGENPMLSDPDINHVKKGLENLEFLVVQDIFLTETAELADVVLPAASFAEKDGTFTATDRRIQRVRKAIDPIGESRPDWQIICDLARLMGSKQFEYSSPSEIMKEIATLTPILGGVTHERLDKGEELLWPCPSPDHTGTEFLHQNRFTRGKGEFVPIEFQEAAELPDEEYPFLLTTGRIIFHYHTGTMTRKTPKLESERGKGYIEMNVSDAERLGLSPGDLVEVASRRGVIQVEAMPTERIPEGIVFMPFHFAESPANALTNPALDPIAKIPELKVCAVKIAKV